FLAGFQALPGTLFCYRLLHGRFSSAKGLRLSTAILTRRKTAYILTDPVAGRRDKINLILRDALSAIDEFREISILDLNGKIVASTEQAHIGQDHSNKNFFLAGNKGNFVDSFSFHGGEAEKIYFAGPVLKEKDILGVAIIVVDLHSITSVIMDYSGLGKTGETLLAKRDPNGDALFLMPLRFDKDATLKRTVPKTKKDVPITQALLKNENLFTDFVDYRGAAVLAATRYIEGVDWGLVVKIDKAEAYAPINHLKNLLGIAMIFISFAPMAVSIYISRSISGPITSLTEMAGRISQGDLRQQIGVKSSDEVGMLSEAFNKMAKNLQESVFSRDYVEGIFASMMDALLVIDLSNNDCQTCDKAIIAKANNAASRLFGYTMDELIGMPCKAVCRGGKDHEDNWIKELVQKENITGEEKYIVKKDGSKIPVLLSACLTRDGEGKIENMTCVMHDITKRKESEETLKNIAAGVAGFTGKDFFSSLVQYLSKTLDMEYVHIAEITSRKEVKARTIAACHNGKIIENFEYHLDGTPCERVWNSGLCFYPGAIAKLFPKDAMLKEMGAECYLGTPLLKSDGSALGLMAIIGRKRLGSPNIPVSMLEIFAVRAAAELERLQVEGDLVRAKEEAEEATKIKDKFVALVAHDLKSPFASILGFMKLMHDDAQDPLAPKHKEMVSRAINAGNNLVHMVDELLKIARLQTGKIILNKKFFDVSLTALSAMGDYSYMAREKGVVLENKIPPATMVYGDMDLIGEVVHNLVSNAIKFCNEGNRATIFSPPGKPSVIAVRDNGIGMDPRIVPDLFRADVKTTTKGTRGEKGTGLGLPLCSDIVKALGGSLTVELSKDEGTTFYINLPDVRPKVLIVDDDAFSRLIAIKFLSETGIDFLEAENGEKAARILEEQTPHLIISDTIMPEMDGFQLLDFAKSSQKLKSIPFIMMTSDSKIETRKLAFQKGANDFVVKPFMAEDFIPRVRRFI
ncbi:MAG: response regulator, partial [Nitrospinae bacterium]|nr:response regulator [Nitrospinota bacterium]